MGKGAYIQINNYTGEDIDITYSNFTGIYQNGEEGSNFTPITGEVAAQGSLPTNGTPQYIEAISSAYQSNFDMDFSILGESVSLKFIENYHQWWVENPFVKFRNASIQIHALVTSGDQYNIVVNIRDSVNPESWMTNVYNKIKDTQLNLLPIPGSHDAMSYPDIMTRSQTQAKTIAEQLMAGFRYFDFRVQVNDGVYYGYHGGDNTEHDYTAVDPTKGNHPFILDDIADFLASHPKELVILNFSHFKNFSKTDDDFHNFVKQVQSHFTGKLVPHSRTPTATYGDCVDNQEQVIVIISDKDDDKAYAQDWFEHPANTPQGQAERKYIWMMSDCLLERYSDVRQASGGDYHANIIQTLQDQEKYLEASQAGQPDYRDLTKFWISQAVLNYDAVTYDGHSLNYWGSMTMNPLVAYIYEFNWRVGQSHNWNGTGTVNLSAPNILLLDYAGFFDGFPEACSRMV